jgi:2-iminobutanoate/2-iminopropanoate deaminase
MPKVIAPKNWPPPLGMYSHGMVAPAGDIVVVAGQVGARQGVPGDDILIQTKYALLNVKEVVEAAGCTLRDVVRLQTFLTRADDIPGFMKARAEVFSGYFPDGVYPPNTLLVVSRLVRPEFLVEIEAMAVRPARAAAGGRGPAKATGRTGTRGRARR